MTTIHFRKRSGFTLIELMVVILIIGVLASLVVGVGVKGIAIARRTANKQNIDQLSSALVAFKTRFQVDYVPSQLVLCDHYATYSSLPAGINGTVASNSLTYLQKLYPRILTYWQTTDIDWNHNGNPSGPEAYTLYGDECLVFLLGGIPNGNTTLPQCTGWAAGGSNPTAHLATTNPQPAINPFFDFAADRLVVDTLGYIPVTGVTPPSPAYPTYHYRYLDTYKQQPYLFFSAYNTLNGYSSVDCPPSLSVLPYGPVLPPNGQFINPQTWQIISAGADGLFGPGGLWSIQNPQQNLAGYALGAPGYDDVANFYDTWLGVIEN